MNDNEVWNLVELPKGSKRVGCKWVFKTKCDSKDNIGRHKARLVAKCYTHKVDIDYKETFSPISEKDSLRFRASSNGCENCLFKWKFRWRSVHGLTRRLYDGRKGTYGV